MSFNFEIEGMDKLQKDLETLGKVPKRHITSAANKGMNIVMRESKGDIPVRTGALAKGVKKVLEKTKRKNAKSVYRIVWDRDMNDIFQTVDKSGKVVGYYPVSQEYGFFTKNGRYIPGFRFISDSFTGNINKIEKTIVSEMQKKIDAEIAKAGLK